MRIFYTTATLVAILSFISISSVVRAQTCKMKVGSKNSELCYGESTELYVNLEDTLLTTFNDDNNQRGNMFMVIAKKDIVITHFDAHPEGDTKYAIYHKTGTFSGFERDSSKWKNLGRHFNVKSNGNGTPTNIPIYFKINVKKGDTASFYVTSTTSVVQNYTNGSTFGKIFSQNSDLQFHEGVGLDWPFTGSSTGSIFSPRVWNGEIHYTLDGKKTVAWSTSDKTDTIKVSPLKNTTYYVDVTVGSCKMRDSLKIDVENLTVNIGKDTTLCAGKSIQLDAGATPTGTVYSWKPGTGGNRYKLISVGGEKTVTVTTPRGCKYRDTIFIQDKKSPNVDLGSDIDLCDGNSIDIDAGDFGTLAKYAWNTSDTTQKINISQGGRYVVTVTDSFGCDAKDNIDVTIRQNPTIDLDGDKELCENDDPILDAGYSDNDTKYAWSNSETSKTITVKTTGGYRVDVESEYGCKGHDSVFYYFHGKPESGMPAFQEACKQDEITLDAGYHGPNTAYNWSTSETSRSIKAKENGDYTVEITDSFGCKNEETITLNFRKLPSVNLGLDQNFCDGESVTLDAVFDDGFTKYNWSTTDTTKTLVVSTSGTYTVTVSDSFGCKRSDEIEILVLDLPKFAWDGDVEICSGETVELDPGNHDKYKWSSSETTRTITVGAGTYSVEITNVFGCANEDTVTVSNVPDASASFSSNDLGGQKVEFTNTSTDATTYTWDFGDGNTSTDESPTHWYKEDGNYTVKLTAVNRCGDNETTESVAIEASSILNTVSTQAKIYPNPNQGLLYLELTTASNEINITVTDISGKVIPTTYNLISNNVWSIKLPSGVGKGMYICNVNSKNEIITKAFMVD